LACTFTYTHYSISLYSNYAFMHLTTCINIPCMSTLSTLYSFTCIFEFFFFIHDCSQSFTCIFQRHIHFSFYNNNITLLAHFSFNILYYLFLMDGTHPPQAIIKIRKTNFLKWSQLCIHSIIQSEKVQILPHNSLIEAIIPSTYLYHSFTFI